MVNTKEEIRQIAREDSYEIEHGAKPTTAEETTTTEHVSHEVTLFAEPLFNIKNFTVTNSLLTAWISILIILIGCLILRKKVLEIPRGIQNLAEIVIEQVLKLMDSITGSRKKSLIFFPLIFGLFIFILVNNWMGLLPGMGSIGFIESENGHNLFIPFFRGGTADLNTTLALSLFAVVSTHIFGIVFIGAWNYINKFINIKAFLEIPKKIIKNPTIILINPIKFFVSLIEIISEISKIASLSFRLFGNIFAGEVLLISIASMVAFVAPIPFMFLEIIVGMVQALVFSILTLVFATIATSKEH